jgi:heavy metal sensor kinase
MSSAPPNNGRAGAAVNKAPPFWRLLAFRLTVWYSVVVAVAAAASFAISYAAVLSAIRSRTDADLAREADRCSDALRTEGLRGLARRFEQDALASGTNDIFFSAFDVRGHRVANSDLSSWSGTQIPPIPALPSAGSDWTVRSTSRNVYGGAGHHQSVRVLTTPIANGQLLLQVGMSVQDDQRVADQVRQVVSLIMIGMLVLAVGVGWVLARRALAGVQRVTSTANDISRGALGYRVPISGRNDEVDQLAATINRMLVRIQTVVEEMEATNDNIAHELRSPVTRIRGLAETTLTARPSLENYQVMAASTIDECDRLLAMINTMLDIAEAEAGVMNLTQGSVDLSALLRQAAELFDPVAAERGIHLQLNLNGPVQVRGDVQRLQRVVANLVDNAIKYADSGGRIWLAAAANGENASISVGNTGPGISDRDLPHIFKRFYRSDPSRSQQGNGLGLSLAQAIVRAHGGTVTVESVRGEQTVFVVSLPLAVRESPPDE